MKRNTLFAAFLVFAMFCASAAFASDVAGYWASTGVDTGDGNVIASVEGVFPANIIAHFQLNEDGSVVAVMMGEVAPDGATWKLADDAVVFFGFDDEPVKASLKEGKILLDMGDGVLVYLENSLARLTSMP